MNLSELVKALQKISPENLTKEEIILSAEQIAALAESRGKEGIRLNMSFLDRVWAANSGTVKKINQLLEILSHDISTDELILSILLIRSIKEKIETHSSESISVSLEGLSRSQKAEKLKELHEFIEKHQK